MSDLRGSGDHLPGRISGLAGWLWVLGAMGTVCFGISAQWEPEAKPAAADRPFAQIGEDDCGGQVCSLGFSPGGASLASATVNGDLWLKTLATGRSFRLHRGPVGSARSLAFSPDGKVLALAGGIPSLALWDAERGIELAPLDVGGVVKCVAFSRDGTMLATGELENSGGSGVVTVWDWVNRRRIAVLACPFGGVNALSFSPDGSQLAAGYSSNLIKLWDITTMQERTTLAALHVRGRIKALAFSSIGDLLATASNLDPIVWLWDAASGEPRGSLRVASEGVNALAFSAEGTLLAIALVDGTASLWDAAQGRQVGAVGFRGNALYAATFSSDGRVLATGGADETVRLWDVARALGGS